MDLDCIEYIIGTQSLMPKNHWIHHSVTIITFLMFPKIITCHAYSNDVLMWIQIQDDLEYVV